MVDLHALPAGTQMSFIVSDERLQVDGAPVGENITWKKSETSPAEVVAWLGIVNSTLRFSWQDKLDEGI